MSTGGDPFGAFPRPTHTQHSCGGQHTTKGLQQHLPGGTPLAKVFSTVNSVPASSQCLAPSLSLSLSACFRHRLSGILTQHKAPWKSRRAFRIFFFTSAFVGAPH